MPDSTTHDLIGGDVAPGFEGVREAFGRHLPDLWQGGGAFAAYVDGVKVVDLWGGQAGPGRPWAEDTAAVVMSATKGLATLCAQVLVDRGQLDIEAPVARYWPEFAQAGKEATLVRHILTHTAGVLSFPGHPDVLHWDGRGWDDYDAIAAGLAAASPSWAPGSRFGYHAMSYGWLVGELVRRVTGRTIGAFLRDEIAMPLGLQCWIGIPAEGSPDVAQILGFSDKRLPFLGRVGLRLLQRQTRNPKTLAGQAYLAHDRGCLLDHAESFLNNPTVQRVEIASGNGVATARSLARAYALFTQQGELDGVRLLSKETVDAFSRTAVDAPDALLAELRIPGVKKLTGVRVQRTIGYLVNPIPPGQPPRFGPNPAAFGHDGAGGQIAFSDLENRIAVGYIRNHLSYLPHLAAPLISAVYACAGRRRAA